VFALSNVDVSLENMVALGRPVRYSHRTRARRQSDPLTRRREFNNVTSKKLCEGAVEEPNPHDGNGQVNRYGSAGQEAPPLSSADLILGHFETLDWQSLVILAFHCLGVINDRPSIGRC
jgi:hypothetical protein